MKQIKCTESKREKKIYDAFPDHVDVQPISSTLSSLKFDTPLKECVAFLGGQLASSKDLRRMMVPRFFFLSASILEAFSRRWLLETLKN
jgi:hypothetical protein